jgi:L-asparaginase
LKLLVTGGTFDKEYDEISGRLFFKQTHVLEMLRLGRSAVPIDVETLMMIDSLEMSDRDRAEVLNRCISSEDSQIVVTHGTDTMENTARVLGEAKIPGKTIVLTGAMVPYKFGSSDGMFNLGSAIAYAQTLPNGVYVAMNGRCFSWENVRKNKTTGEFYEEKK